MLVSGILFVLLLSWFQSVLASGNGMVMSMDGAMPLGIGNMIPYLHFTPGDNLWFLGWVPRSAGAMVGTCIGLFLLALVERWIAASRAVMEAHWIKRAQILQQDMANQSVTSTKPSTKATRRTSPPFIPAHDLTRGLLHIVQATLGFLFMLTVMTFQAGFIFAIVAGLGVGETLFGRYGSSALHMA